MTDKKKERGMERKAIWLGWGEDDNGEPRSLRAHGGVVVEVVEEKRALRPVGYSTSSVDNEGKSEKRKDY